MLKDYTRKLRMMQKKKSKEKKQYVSKKEKRDKKLNTDSYSYPLTKFEKEYLRLFPEEK